MENDLKKTNYLEAKYSLDNLKKQKNSIINNPTTFTGFDRISVNKESVVKYYYDTPDFFFQNNGISININTYKGSKTSALVVRWDTSRERIAFLSDIPTTFELQVLTKDSIYKHIDFIAESISELVPSGLNVDVPQVLRSIVNVFSVSKQRECYKYINFNGLKLKISFSKTLYSTTLNRKKELAYILEVKSEDTDRKEEYEAFTKKIEFNNPTIIKLIASDMRLGRDYLFPEPKKEETK